MKPRFTSLKNMFNQKGAVLPVIVFAIIALLGIGALGVDGGYYFLTKLRTQRAVDAAAVSVAHMLRSSLEDDEIEAEALKVAKANLDLWGVNYNCASCEVTAEVNSETRQITVNAKVEAPIFLAAIFPGVSGHTLIPSAATSAGGGNLAVVLVLDESGSMCNNLGCGVYGEQVPQSVRDSNGVNQRYYNKAYWCAKDDNSRCCTGEQYGPSSQWDCNENLTAPNPSASTPAQDWCYTERPAGIPANDPGLCPAVVELRAAAKAFLDSFSETSDHVSLITYNEFGKVRVPFCAKGQTGCPADKHWNRETFKDAIDLVKSPSGHNTNIQDGLVKAIKETERFYGTGVDLSNAVPAIVLMTDGMPTKSNGSGVAAFDSRFEPAHFVGDTNPYSGVPNAPAGHMRSMDRALYAADIAREKYVVNQTLNIERAPIYVYTLGFNGGAGVALEENDPYQMPPSGSFSDKVRRFFLRRVANDSSGRMSSFSGIAPYESGWNDMPKDPGNIGDPDPEFVAPRSKGIFPTYAEMIDQPKGKYREAQGIPQLVNTFQQIAGDVKGAPRLVK